MELVSIPTQPQLMSTLSTRLTPLLLRPLLSSSAIATTAAVALNISAAAATSTDYTTSTIIEENHPPIVPDSVLRLPPKTKTKTRRGNARGSKVISEALLKENWLNSLSCPLPTCSETEVVAAPGWVLGVDPDISGALAVLRPEGSVEVFDSPHLKVLVGKRQRKRLDAKSIVQLVQSFNAPIGTTAYMEQSIPYPQDGKQDDSRELASTLFPSMSFMLKRKKDHGRAEALLIAAYGKGLKMTSESTCMVDNVVP